MESVQNKILAIGGSPRKSGNTDILVKHFLKGVREEGLSSTMIHLRDYAFSSCTGCELCRKDGKCHGLLDGMQLIYPEVLSSRGLILFSPVHTYNITAWMKAFIDRLYCFYRFFGERPGEWDSRLKGQKRKAAVGVILEQNREEDMGVAMPALQKPLESLGYEIVCQMRVFGIFNKGRVSDYPEILEEAREKGRIISRAVASSFA